MRGRFVVQITCPACRRNGVVADQALAEALVSGRRPRRFRCDRRVGGCGFSHPAVQVDLIISWAGDEALREEASVVVTRRPAP